MYSAQRRTSALVCLGQYPFIPVLALHLASAPLYCQKLEGEYMVTLTSSFWTPPTMSGQRLASNIMVLKQN